MSGTIERAQAEKAILDRIGNGTSFTYGELCLGKLKVGNEDGRLADRLIQRLRKKGLIAFTRDGRQTIWNLTDAGKIAMAERGK